MYANCENSAKLLNFFQVTPDGLADKGGIRLGDIILEINEEDATELTLTQAHEKIDASGKKIHFLVKKWVGFLVVFIKNFQISFPALIKEIKHFLGSMEEDEDFELGEEKSIVLRVPKPAPPPRGECENLVFLL